MSELHEALGYLSPTDWDDLSKDNLPNYLSRVFTAGELLVNSVPPPPSGTPFESALPRDEVPNSARSAKDVHPSSARPAAPDKEHEDLQKHWGKPMKFSQKENPLGVALFKMAGHDRHGAWYARHNIVEGIGFAKFKKALMREFPETLLVQGKPGAGAKRGLSAERRVERMDVNDVGRVEVYQLSAQMPSPVTPRDFLTLLLTTSTGLTEKSSAETRLGDKHVPRSYMIVSRPLNHAGAPQRSAFVRGQYESVELIREIPLHVSKSTSDLLSDSGEETDPELNPVQWIMVTRSDPAGGVPRFLVDRGTPGAMLTDVTKFLDWACGQEEITEPDEDLELQQQLSREKTNEISREMGVEPPAAAVNDGTTEAVEKAAPEPTQDASQTQDTTSTQDPTQPEGVVSNLTNSIEAGVSTYAPTPVANFVHRQLHPEPATTAAEMSDSSDSSSIDSFLSAEEMKRMTTAPEEHPRASNENLSVASAASSSEISRTDRKLTPHEKEIQRIAKQREALDQKLAKKRETEENKLKQSQEKEDTESGKARERMEREMKKTEERHRKEIEKLEAKREKEIKKTEDRRRKREDQNKLSLVARERDEFRRQAELLRKESELLSDQVEALQRENTALAGKLGKVGGQEAVRSVQEEIGRSSRAGTMRSMDGSSQGSEKKDG